MGGGKGLNRNIEVRKEVRVGGGVHITLKFKKKTE